MQKIEKLSLGSYYHIYNKGINGENLFKEEKNYFYFLDRLKKYVLPVAELYAYCLLKNHFHMLVRIRDNNELDTSKQFAHCFNSYTQSINKQYNRTGGLFQTPFRRKEVSNETYIMWLIWYIHANPQKHGFADDFRDWRWSSYHEIVSDDTCITEKEKIILLFDNKSGFIDFHQMNKEYYQDLALEE